MERRFKNHRLLATLFLLSFGFIYALHWSRSDYRKTEGEDAGYYMYHSDRMMQTLSSYALWQHPIESILYLHKQPPMLDLIRATFMNVFNYGEKQEFVRKTADDRMILLHMILFSVLGCFIFTWLRNTIGMTGALVAWLAWIFHPSPIYYTALLDATMITTALVTWLFYELYVTYKNPSQSSYSRIAVSVGLLFLTRTPFQLIFFIGFIPCLFFLGYSTKKVMKTLAIISLFIAPYFAKQIYFFDTIQSSSFNGYEMYEMLWLNPKPEITAKKYIDRVNLRYPDGIDELLTNDPFNNRQQALENAALQLFLGEWIRNNPGDFIWRLGRSFKYSSPFNSHPSNPNHYWKQSWIYIENRLTDDLPWAKPYYWVFHEYGFPLIFYTFCLSYLWINREEVFKNKKSLLKLTGFIGPFFYLWLISHLSNRSVWSEANRLKFYMEPVYYTFVIYQSVILIRRLYKLRAPKLHDLKLKLLVHDPKPKWGNQTE